MIRNDEKIEKNTFYRLFGYAAFGWNSIGSLCLFYV